MEILLAWFRSLCRLNGIDAVLWWLLMDMFRSLCRLNGDAVPNTNIRLNIIVTGPLCVAVHFEGFRSLCRLNSIVTCPRAVCVGIPLE